MRETQNEIEAELAELEAESAVHLLDSEPVKAALAFIEQHGEEGKEIVQQQLAEQNLPSRGELGRLTAMHAFSWWRLYRTRKNLVTRTKRLKH